MGELRVGRRVVAALAAAPLLLAACSGGDEPAEDASTTPAPTPTTTAPAAQVTLEPGVTIPDTRAGEAAGWVLDQLGAAEGPSAEEAQERFAEVFLAQVPAGQVAGVFDQLRASGPFVVAGYNGAEDAAQLPLEGPEERYILHVLTDADGRMNTLFFQGAQPVPELGSVEDLGDAVADLGIDASVLVADGATCEPLHAREADVARPIGSIVKLYVLDAVRQAVADGELAWEDTLTLTDDLRSLPSGVLQEEPAGHEVTVREAAELMISISDNTATDLLIDAVGREAVLAAVERLGHHDPELLTPLVTTRELFQLAFTDVELREQWAAADAEGRGEILAGLPGGEVEVDPALAQDVVWPQGLDWFATAEDLCRAQVGLQEAEEEGEPVADILALNPGIEVPEGWYVASKGGRAPGELAGSWYLEAEGEAPYVVVLQLAATDLTAVPDAGWMSDVAGRTAQLLSEEG